MEEGGMKFYLIHLLKCILSKNQYLFSENNSLSAAYDQIFIIIFDL